MVEFVRDVIVAVAVLAAVIALAVRAMPEYEAPHLHYGLAPPPNAAAAARPSADPERAPPHPRPLRAV